jgi:hypothetical protein
MGLFKTILRTKVHLMALTKPQIVKETVSQADKAAVIAEQETLTAAGVEATVEAVVEAPVVAEVAAEPEVETAEVLTEEGVEATVEQAETAVALAEPAAGTAVSVTAQRTNAMAQFTQDQAEAGYEGMDLTSFSFDRIKLHEGTFKIGQEETDLGNSFKAVVMGTRRLFVVRQSTDNDAESYYSYDAKGATMTDGSSAEAKLEEWFDEGYGVEGAPLDIREYCEAMALMVGRTDEYTDAMVTLSIPPASKSRLAGMAFQAKSRLKSELNGVVLECQVGKKAGEGAKSFRPWLFKLVGRYEG